VVRLVKSLRGALGSLKHPGGVITAVGLIAIAAGTLAGIKLIPMPEMAAGPIIGTGTTLFAMGVSELLRFYRSTTELDYTLDLEKFDNSYRVSALINNPGNVIVKDAKAVITVEAKPEELRNMLASFCLGSTEYYYLVNKHNPKIEGEVLPWALPEKPIKRPALQFGVYTYTDYTHITSISPHQRARLLLFEFEFDKDADRYLIKFFSEYGAPGPADPAPRYYRACLYIDREIRARVYVSGEGLRRPLEFCLKISKNVLDSIVNNPKEVEKLSQC